MTEKSKAIRNVLSLEEKHAERTIVMAVGKYGVQWVFDVIASVFQEIADDDETYTVEQQLQAEFRADLLRGLGSSIWTQKKE